MATAEVISMHPKSVSAPPQSCMIAAEDLWKTYDMGSEQQVHALRGVNLRIERGEYVAATGKFVMSGGNPTLYDGSAGTTTGRQLTFYLADDTIIVDSENGSRTLTKHRVEK